jgi:hypothetical protein
VAFLQQQCQVFRPLLAHGRDLRLECLRATILRELPSTVVVELGGPPKQRSSLPCENPQQCTLTLSWRVFLPVCLQAAATDPLLPTAAP